MGARAVRAAMAQYRELDDPSMRLLVHMAVIAVDPGNNRAKPRGHDFLRYWGGWDLQALALGLRLPDVTDPDPWARAESVRRMVHVFRRRIIDADAIELVKRAYPGHPAEYAINVDLEVADDVDNSETWHPQWR